MIDVVLLRFAHHVLDITGWGFVFAVVFLFLWRAFHPATGTTSTHDDAPAEASE